MGWYVMLLFCLPRESESALTNLIGTCYWNLYRTNKIRKKVKGIVLQYLKASRTID